MSKSQFLNDIAPYAEKASNSLGIPASWIAAHWAHETGYKINQRNNLAGIWAYPTSPFGIAGKSYTDLEQFTNDYIKLLQNGRYSQALKADSVNGFAAGLKAGGYASDPKYAFAKTWGEASQMYKGGGSGSKDAGAVTPTFSDQNIDNPIWENDLFNVKEAPEKIILVVAGLIFLALAGYRLATL